MLLRLGDVTFSTDSCSYDALNQTQQHRWQSIPRLNQSPVQHYLGPGELTITLKGTLYPYHNGGHHQLGVLQQRAATGQPQLLISGQGQLLGQWCILSVRDNQHYLTHNGQPQKITFTIQLRRYDNHSTHQL